MEEKVINSICCVILTSLFSISGYQELAQDDTMPTIGDDYLIDLLEPDFKYNLSFVAHVSQGTFCTLSKKRSKLCQKFLSIDKWYFVTVLCMPESNVLTFTGVERANISLFKYDHFSFLLKR